MALSNTAVPKYYGEFREKVIRGEIPVNEKISLQMNRIDRLIEHGGFEFKWMVRANEMVNALWCWT